MLDILIHKFVFPVFLLIIPVMLEFLILTFNFT